MKMYAVVTDVSPSEQITGNDDEVKVMGMVVGLHYRNSFDEVGQKFPDKNHRFHLKKWSGSSFSYKFRVVDHARFLLSTGNVMFGTNATSERNIIDIGEKVFQQLEGPFPNPTSFNKKGKPRLAMGGYGVDGEAIPMYEVLIDELVILGWYTESLVAFHQKLININGEDIKLGVIIDRLPLEKGGKKSYKATLLKKLLSKASRELVNLAGIPAVPDGEPRDLLVDNICGMGRELALRPDSKLSRQISEPDSVIQFSRFNL